MVARVANLMQVANDLWYDGYHNLDDFREKYHEKYHKESICQSCSLK